MRRCGELGGVVEPQLREAQRLRDGGVLLLRGVSVLRELAERDVFGELVIDRVVRGLVHRRAHGAEHLAELVEDRAEIAAEATGRLLAAGATTGIAGSAGARETEAESETTGLLLAVAAVWRAYGDEAATLVSTLSAMRRIADPDEEARYACAQILDDERLTREQLLEMKIPQQYLP